MCPHTAARAGHQDMCAIQARIHARKEHAEEEHTGRVVRRLASLTKRMDSLNASLGMLTYADVC